MSLVKKVGGLEGAKIPIANLGTGYFAPETEKELTSMQVMAQHVLWLAAILQEVAKNPIRSR